MWWVKLNGSKSLKDWDNVELFWDLVDCDVLCLNGDGIGVGLVRG